MTQMRMRNTTESNCPTLIVAALTARPWASPLLALTASMICPNHLSYPTHTTGITAQPVPKVLPVVQHFSGFKSSQLLNNNCLCHLTAELSLWRKWVQWKKDTILCHKSVPLHSMGPRPPPFHPPHSPNSVLAMVSFLNFLLAFKPSSVRYYMNNIHMTWIISVPWHAFSNKLCLFWPLFFFCSHIHIFIFLFLLFPVASSHIFLFVLKLIS